MSIYNVCGVMIHTRKEYKQQVQNVLNQTQGVEVHAATDEGKLVVTVESEDKHHVADTISSFKDIKGVLCASMIYQFSDDSNSTSEGVAA